LQLADDIFKQIAARQLGFAHRFESFFSTMVITGEINLENIWLLWQDAE